MHSVITYRLNVRSAALRVLREPTILRAITGDLCCCGTLHVHLRTPPTPTAPLYFEALCTTLCHFEYSEHSVPLHTAPYRSVPLRTTPYRSVPLVAARARGGLVRAGHFWLNGQDNPILLCGLATFG